MRRTASNYAVNLGTWAAKRGASGVARMFAGGADSELLQPECSAGSPARAPSPSHMANIMRIRLRDGGMTARLCGLVARHEAKVPCDAAENHPSCVAVVQSALLILGTGGAQAPEGVGRTRMSAE